MRYWPSSLTDRFMCSSDRPWLISHSDRNTSVRPTDNQRSQQTD